MLLSLGLFVAALVLPGSSAPSADYLTQHYDSARTGWYPYETQLTQSNVSPSAFGVVGSLAVDGDVYAQPLYVQNVRVGGSNHNVLIVATEYDSVYAFDADSLALLWQRTFIDPSRNIYPASSSRCTQIQPWIGVSSTPVIDPATGTIYVVAKTQARSGDLSSSANTIHALAIGTGKDVTIPRLIAGSVKMSDGSTDTFDQMERNRPALLLANDRVYVGMGSNCDDFPLIVHGWVFAFDTPTLRPDGVFNTTTDVADEYLATIWQSTFGLSADPAGSVYFATGNGAFDASASGGGDNYGDSVMKMSPSLAVQDWFRPYLLDITDDNDLGSGGVMVLPQQSGSFPDMAVAAGKLNDIYLLNRDDLGGYSPSGPDRVLYEVPYTLPGPCEGGPAYFADATGTFIYYARNNAPMVAYALTTSPTPQLAAASQTSTIYEYGGTIPAVSSNGTTPGTAIVWAVIRSQPKNNNPGTLQLAAYNADNLGQSLYVGSFTNWNNANGHPMLTPTIADGKVFVGGAGSVTVFGSLASAHRKPIRRARPA